MANPLPDDNSAYRFPVSIKGVVFLDSRVALLKNLRDEWELPGGKLEPGETPEECVAREIQEELGLSVRVGDILDTWVYRIVEGVEVLIVTFGCYPSGCYPSAATEVVPSSEHRAAGLFSIEQVAGLNMPQGYRRSIHDWWSRLASSA